MASNNPRRTQSTKRDRIRRQVLFEEHVCWLCNEPIDKTLPHGLPGSPELDEILPLSLGGNPFDRNNIHLAHRLCNQKRGNKLPPEAIQLAKERAKNAGPLKKSRKW